jgi:hypothetical protein
MHVPGKSSLTASTTTSAQRLLAELEELADGIGRRHVRRRMKRWSGHRIRAVLVALVVALGMSASVVKGGLMAVEMAVSAEAGHTGSSDCDGCGGSAHEADAAMCLAVCGSAAHALLTAEPMALPPASEASFQAVHPLVNGLSDNPDPGPPKTLTFG